MWTSFHGIHVAQSGCCWKVHLVLTRSHLPAWPAGEMLQKRNCICKTVSQSMLPVFAVTSAATSLLHLLLKALWECRTATWIGYVIGTVQARANYSAMVSGSSMLEAPENVTTGVQGTMWNRLRRCGGWTVSPVRPPHSRLEMILSFDLHRPIREWTRGFIDFGIEPSMWYHYGTSMWTIYRFAISRRERERRDWCQCAFAELGRQESAHRSDNVVE